MTFILELPIDLERDLEIAAASAGLPLAGYALQILAANLIPATDEAPPRNGADLLAYWEREGLLGSRTDIEDPAEYARELRERTQRRRYG